MTNGSLIDLMPFSVGLGINLVSASGDSTVGRLEWAADRCTTGGLLHGGVLMTLADSVAAVCAFLNLPKGATTSTVESKTNFFRPVTEGYVEAKARPLHIGRRFVVIQTDISDAHGRLVAQTTQTQAVIRPPDR
jgi:1,4-dihydroxy-2-naphthoyl-CoA hydrolase